MVVQHAIRDNRLTSLQVVIENSRFELASALKT